MKKIASVFMLLLMLFVSSCKFLNKYGSYPNANSYHTINENGEIFQSPIKNIYVDWVNGSVDICQSDDYQSIAVFEKTNSEKIDEKYKCKLFEKKGVDLYIKYCASSISMPAKLSKSLKIYIPTNYILENITINNVTASVLVKDLKLNSLIINDVSGKTNVHDVEAFDIDYSGVSGSFTSSVLFVTSNINVSQVSGKTILSVPANLPGFTLTYDTTTGKLNSDHQLQNDEESNNVYYYNQKDYLKINVSSVSGDLLIANYDTVKEPIEKDPIATPVIA